MFFRYFFTLLFSLVAVASFSQKKVYLSMNWEEVKKNKAVFYCELGEEENGKYPANVYYTDETLYCTGSFNSKEISYDTRDGKFEYFFYSGKKMCEGEFKAGKKHGNWKIYYSNGVLERTGNYEAGSKIGKWLNYDETGSFKDTSEFVGSNYTGEYTRYKNGVLKEKCYYLNGQYHGAIKQYYANGGLFNTGYYDSGFLVGEWKYYNSNGNLASRIYYSRINRIDSVFYYNEDGSINNDRIDTSIINKHPEFDTLQKVIFKNIIYPPQAIENLITGKVNIAFSVLANGETIGFRCDDDIKLDFGLEEECIRVLKLLKFKPHKICNLNYTMAYRVPLKFKLQ